MEEAKVVPEYQLLRIHNANATIGSVDETLTHDILHSSRLTLNVQTDANSGEMIQGPGCLDPSILLEQHNRLGVTLSDELTSHNKRHLRTQR